VTLPLTPPSEKCNSFCSLPRRADELGLPANPEAIDATMAPGHAVHHRSPGPPGGFGIGFSLRLSETILRGQGRVMPVGRSTRRTSSGQPTPSVAGSEAKESDGRPEPDSFRQYFDPAKACVSPEVASASGI
jgi:hypothetical protein